MKTGPSKTWLITGASSGIGLALTRMLLEDGHRVAAIVRRPEKIADLTHEYHDRLIPFELDLGDLDRLESGVAHIIERMGDLDVVMSGAGYALVGAVEELSGDQIRRSLDVNLIAPMLLIRTALAHLRRRRRGHIIQISSEGGQMAYPAAGIYHAGKWGLEGFCEALAQEISPFGLHVTLVEPGRIATPFDGNAIAAAMPIEEYRRSTVGRYLQLVKMGRFPCIGDPVKIAAAIRALADDPAPPLRLVLGSDSLANIESALKKRLSSLRDQAGTASATDFDKPLKRE